MDLDDKGVHEARGKWMRYVQGRSRRVGSAYWGSLPSVAADPSILLTTLKRWVRLAVKMILRAAVIPRSPWIRGSRKPGDPVAEIERENDFLEKIGVLCDFLVAWDVPATLNFRGRQITGR